MWRFCCFLFLFVAVPLVAQKRVEISGRVVDKSTGNPLVGAYIIDSIAKQYALANADGFFSIWINDNTEVLKVSMIGFQNAYIKVAENRLNVFIELDTDLHSLEEVSVSAIANKRDAERQIAGYMHISKGDLNKLPTFMGERDIIKSLQLLPGIHSNGEGNMGYFVRGGSAGQNLNLIDEVPVYGSGHILGIFSSFPDEIVSNADIYKATIPAEYGGRLSSVAKINTPDDHSKFKCSAAVSNVLMKCSAEGQGINDRISYLVSFRRSMLDVFLAPFSNSIKTNSSVLYQLSNYYFYDAYAKVNFKINSKNKISSFILTGKDKFKLLDENVDLYTQIQWGDRVVGLNHTYRTSAGILSTSIYESNNQYGFDIRQGNNYLYTKSAVTDRGLTSTYHNRFNNDAILKFGISAVLHSIKPQNIDAGITNLDLNVGGDITLQAFQPSCFISFQKNITPKFEAYLGVRFSSYHHLGPYTYYSQDLFSGNIDSTVYKNNTIINSFYAIDPRLNFSYKINKSNVIRFSLSRMSQFMHQLSMSSVSLPNDVWFPSTAYLLPEYAYQSNFGYTKDIKNIRLVSDVYVKYLGNQVEFVNSLLEPYNNLNIAKNTSVGEALAYGLEFQIQKNQGKTTGWLSYSLAKVDKMIKGLNENQSFPAKYDRRHYINLVANYEFSSRISFSCLFVYATGNAFTLPISRYMIQGTVVNRYTSVNGFRMPDYHRADVSIHYRLKKKNNFESSLIFSVYNVYNRQNAFAIFFTADGDLDEYRLNVFVNKISLLPILPALTYQIRFL